MKERGKRCLRQLGRGRREQRQEEEREESRWRKHREREKACAGGAVAREAREREWQLV